jgi:hypothetical protein
MTGTVPGSTSKLKLQPNTEFSACFRHAKLSPSQCAEIGKLKSPHTGTLILNSKVHEDPAVFASPDLASCQDGTATCSIYISFDQSMLDKLSASNLEVRKFIVKHNDSQLTLRLTLQPDTEFSDCFWHSRSTPSECVAIGKLKSPYTGDFKLKSMDRENEDPAVFASPDLASCQDGTATCSIHISFDQSRLDKLRASNLEVREFIAKHPATLVTRNVQTGGDLGQGLLSRGLNIMPELSIVLVGAIVFFGVVSYCRRSSRHNEHSHRDRSRSRSDSSRNQGGAIDSRSDQLVSPLSDLKIDPLSGLKIDPLSDLKIEIATFKRTFNRDVRDKLETLQEGQDSIRKSLKDFQVMIDDLLVRLDSSPRITQPTPASPHAVKPSVNQPPTNQPPVLSHDLVREAVATNNYSLISSYPHWFITETQESREGKVKTQFSIDGTHQNAKQFARSDFILIGLSDQYVLIPNLVSGATRPELRLKRAAENKRIYEQAEGSSGYMIETFATVDSHQGTHNICFLLSVGRLT